MKRFYLNELVKWKNKNNRNPLILKGTRQVGKTYLLKEFGQKYFLKVHYFNFEKDETLATVFSKNLDPKRILNELAFIKNESINSKEDLIIFDEIQFCSKALTSLKYFSEEMPELAICSAGSLLGIYLSESSFPVGKVDFLNLFPMSFEEFLLANDDSRSYEVIQRFDTNDQIPDVIHTHLWEQLKSYFVVGGLPSVVTIFKENKNNLFEAYRLVREKQNDLINSYLADIAKHSGKENAMHVSRLWQHIPKQLACHDDSAEKFKFKGIIPGISSYVRLANVIDWLYNAGLIFKVPIISTNQLPLSAHTKDNFFKLFIFDIGILGAMSNLSPKTIYEYTYGSYKGYFAENFVAQALHSLNKPHLYCWREGNSEIEFLIDLEETPLPIEVKSGWVTKSKSLSSYIHKYHPPYSVILSGKNIFADKSKNKFGYPLYLISKIFTKKH